MPGNKWKARWRWTALGAVLSSVVALSVAASPAGAATAGPAAGPAGARGGVARLLAAGTPVPAGPAAGPSQTVTLVTGDVVRVTGKPGHQSAEITKNAGGGAGSLSIVEFRQRNDLYVIPGAAVPLIAAGKLDQSLFDVSELARDGYTGSTLPVLVTYTSGALAARAQGTRQLAGTAGGSRYLWSIRGLAATVNLAQGRNFFNSVTTPAAPAGSRSAEGMAVGALTLRPGVAKVWLDAKVHATGVDVSRTAIGADKAWAAGYQGATAKVAILDTGIDQTHPDLAGQVTAAQNFVPAGNPGGGNPADVTDRFGHGTHVAGIIAATGAASGGLYNGVAPKAQLVIGKVLGDDGSGDDSWIIAGMQWAAGQAKIISMSLGGCCTDGTDPLSQALDTISSSTGALFVVAAGNDGISPEGNINGGPGSCAQCIESPGSATAALTVGAVDDGCDFSFTDPNTCTGRGYSDNNIVYFSSTGPRLNDFAIKPDITAPGVDVPSARAAGTSLGTPVAAYPNLYTYLSGTSMATPMVAGSAAVLLGQHPTWTAQQLRDALTSTATANTYEPAYWQGSGMVNVGRAATQTIFGTGDLNLGTAAYPQQPGTLLTGTITYTNTGPAPETLTLRSSFATAPDNFSFQASQKPWSPPAGAVSLPGQVTVPAGGSRTVQLSIDASQAPYFSTYGRITAAAADGTTVTTTVGFTRAALTHKLSLTAIDRTGTPETTTFYSFGNLMDLTDGQTYLVTFTNGAGTIWGGVRDNQLIADHSYAFVGQIATFGPAPYYRLQSWTQVAEPQITMNADRSFTFDARNAGLINVGTQRPAISLHGCSTITRTAPDPSRPAGGFFLAFTNCGNASTRQGEDIYTLAGGQATTGTLQEQYYTHREQAPITVTAHGLDTPLLPRYAAVTDDYGFNFVATASQPRFPASARLQVADVGTGTPAEIAAAQVAGKIALLHLPGSSPVRGDVGDGFYMQLDGVTAKAIASAGAAGILVAPPADGIAGIWYNSAGVPPVPTALLSSQEAAQLSGLLTAGQSSVTVTTAWPSPYSYDLGFTQSGGLTNGAKFRAKDEDLARVTTRYHSTTPGQYGELAVLPILFYGQPFYSEAIPARTIRTEMYTPGTVFYQTREVTGGDYTYLTEQVSRSLAAGQYDMNVGSGPWVPGDGIYVISSGPYLNAEVSADGLSSSAGFQAFLNGYPDTTKLVCQPPACQETPNSAKLSGDGLYQVINDVAESAPGVADNPLSVRTHTEWTVNVHLNPDPRVAVTQPAIQTTWYVDDGLDNVVPARTPYTVRVVPSFPDGTGSHGPLTARLWATYDDGQTWVQVPGIQVVKPGEAATFTLRTPAQTNGFVGYRVQMSDADGNAINQAVIRAAYTQPPAS